MSFRSKRTRAQASRYPSTKDNYRDPITGEHVVCQDGEPEFQSHNTDVRRSAGNKSQPPFDDHILTPQRDSKDLPRSSKCHKVSAPYEEHVQSRYAQSQSHSFQSQRTPSDNEQSGDSEEDIEDDGDFVHGDSQARHTRIPNWPKEITFDAWEKVEIRDKDGNSTMRGGTIVPSNVWAIQQGQRFVVPFNSLYQPLRKGGHVLVWFLGDVAKNGDLCPIGEVSWHHVDKQYKADIITLVRQKFVLPPSEIINKKILQRVGRAWRNYRCQLKKKYVLPGKTKYQISKKVPERVNKHQWINLVSYWFSEECEKFSIIGKEARASQDQYHTTGSTSFAMKRDDFETKNGRAPGPLEFYKASHKRKDGTYKEDSSSKEFVETADALIDECITQTSMPREIVEKQIFNKLMYDNQSEQDKKYQRVVGYGMGVTYNEIFVVNGEIRNRGFTPTEGSTEEEVVRLRADVVKMKSQLDIQSQQIQKQSEQMQGMQREIQSKFQNISLLLTQLVGHSNSASPAHLSA